MGQTDHRAEVREFLGSRRARITLEQAGLPAYGGMTWLEHVTDDDYRA